MSQKRRGLGRGLGALIPSSPAGSRPSDVFFEGSPSLSPDSAGAGVQAAGGKEVPANTEAFGGSTLADEDTSNVSRETTPAGSHAPDRAGAAGQQEIANSDAFGKRPSDEPSGTAGASGRGDAATSQGDDANGAGLLPVPGARFLELDPALIHPNSKQPRVDFDEDDLAELISSIGEVGVLQPVIVRPSREDDGHYELIMGERRWRATQAAGLPTIPAIVRDTDDEDLLRDALLENLHRSALNPLEEAAAYQQLLDDFGCTHEELSTRIARSRPQISNTLRLLKLPPLVQRRVAAGVLSAGHARALLRLDDSAAMERLAQRIVAEGLSVRATEEIAALGGLVAEPSKPRLPRPGQRVEAIDHLAGRLSDRFDTRVRISLGKSKGRVSVEFATVEDLNRILALMAPDEPGLFDKR